VKKIVTDTKMREAYADDSDESINKRANIEEFINSVEEYCRLNPGVGLTDYLNQVTLSSDTDEMDDSNYVTLATVHSVKGLEFKCVFVCGLEENILPVSRAVGDEEDMEEERRLMYVAITRAKERLYLTRSKSRYLYGKREPTMRSRFLKELSSEMDMPQETRRPTFSYRDDYDEDEGGRYETNDDYGDRRNSYGGGSYGSYGSYGSHNSYNSYGARSSYSSYSSQSSYSRSSNNSYGGTGGYGGYGSSSYGSYGTQKKNEGVAYGGASKLKKTLSPTAAKDLSAFQIGKKVRHPKFGDGMIVGVRGTGSNMILDIAFEGLGIKQLSASLAPLTVGNV